MINLKNWKDSTSGVLVLITGIVASLTAFTPQFLSVLHEAPFPVSTLVDDWLTWILKLATIILSLFSIFTKAKSANDE
jgi:uncharacterized membrane protein